MFAQRGVGLIEVLVTVLIIGTSILAISAMQVRALQQTHSASLSTQANILAYDLLERVRMASELAPAPLTLPDQDDIDELVEALLPTGTADLDCDADRVCTVTLTWSELSSDADRVAEETSTFTYTSRI